MIKAKDLLGYLKSKSITFFSGVPCSFLKSILEEALADPHIRYIPACRENAALGIASGCYLAGRHSSIMIQNSGVGNIINALTSFNLIYKIPVLMFITWRGYLGKDAPEHIIMGKKTIRLLKEIGIPSRILSPDYKEDIEWAVKFMASESIPVALIIKKGIVE